jgi:hypothetical protein
MMVEFVPDGTSLAVRAHCSFIRTEPEGIDAKSKTNKNFVLFVSRIAIALPR